MVALVALVAQIPGILTLGHLLGSYAGVIAGAALLTIPFVWSTLRNPFQHQVKSRARLLLTQWPFYVWWTICLTHFLFAPAALLVAALSPASFPVSLNQALGVAGAVSVVVGLAALRRTPRIVAQRIAIVDLPPELEGYRIAQLSDVHCGPFTPPERVRRWVARANALGADLIAVTGDLITSGGDYVDAVATELGALHAPDGVLACMGNHDYFTEGDQVIEALERHGTQVLRNRGVTIARGGARLYVAGVDDTWTKRQDMPAALRARPDGAPVVLLAHDPSLFVEAAAHGVDLTLSGHTHGGQVAVPGASRRLNLARIITPFTAGFFHQGRSTLHVSRGLGTTGPPVRLVARPEIALLELRHAPISDEPLGELAEDVIREASRTS